MPAPPRFNILLYDNSWGLSVIRPAQDDPLFRWTHDTSRLPHADIVVFHIPTAPHPTRVRKYPGQIWAAHSLESEVNYPRLADADFMSHFDVRMTYRWDSDVPLMYWQPPMRGLLLQPPATKTAAEPASFFASNDNAVSGRSGYAGELMRHLPVASYGRVHRNQALPHDEGRPSKLATIARHRFDLAFENSLATDYVTEKFYDPLIAGCVPVYRGAPNIEEFAPGDRCFINAADFATPRSLAEYLVHLAAHPAEYEAYFAWKQRPLRESFLRKTAVAGAHPFHRLCELLRARGCTPRRAAGGLLWRRLAGA